MELSASSKAQVLRFESFRAGWKLKSVCVRGRCGWNGGSDFIWAFMGSLPQLKTHRIGTYFWLVKPLLVKTQPSGQVCSPLKTWDKSSQTICQPQVRHLEVEQVFGSQEYKIEYKIKGPRIKSGNPTRNRSYSGYIKSNLAFDKNHIYETMNEFLNMM